MLCDVDDIYLDGINWVIIGGESGPGFRPMEWGWADNLLVACEEHAVPVWFKQWGGNSKEKGGSLLNGREHKTWPNAVA